MTDINNEDDLPDCEGEQTPELFNCTKVQDENSVESFFDFSGSIFLSTVYDLWFAIVMWTTAMCAFVFFIIAIYSVRKNKDYAYMLYFPLLFTILGTMIGFLQGSVSGFLIASIYISVPYHPGIDIAAGLGIGQALIIIYLHMGRADFIHR